MWNFITTCFSSIAPTILTFAILYIFIHLTKRQILYKKKCYRWLQGSGLILAQSLLYTRVYQTYFGSKELVAGTHSPMQNTKLTPRKLQYSTLESTGLGSKHSMFVRQIKVEFDVDNIISVPWLSMTSFPFDSCNTLLFLM